MMEHNDSIRYARRAPSTSAGVTLVELMVALAIGSFLIIGAVQVYNQSRQAFLINESIARVQETAQFAMDTIESDLRMASNWGRSSRGDSIEGRSIEDDANPLGLLAPATCGLEWALDLTRPIVGSNNSYGLACLPPPDTVAQPNSDTVTIRRATVEPQAETAGRLQLQTSRIQGELFDDGVIPASFDPTTSATHNLLVNSYYVATSSQLVGAVPTLRRKSLGIVAGVPGIVDEEVAPGVENLQIQFGVDVNSNNTIDRYVNPGDPILDPDPANAAYIPGARVMTARIWLVVRSIDREGGIVDPRDYEPGDVDLGVPADEFRRLQVSKTVLLRNART